MNILIQSITTIYFTIISVLNKYVINYLHIFVCGFNYFSLTMASTLHLSLKRSNLQAINQSLNQSIFQSISLSQHEKKMPSYTSNETTLYKHMSPTPNSYYFLIHLSAICKMVGGKKTTKP